ncbi:MAG: histidine phosphatase family protein [Actinomycetota bacterium]
MSLLHYVSHPNVVIDPDVPVPSWGLSDEGRRRARAMLDQPWLASVRRIVSSAEAKAEETADIVGERLGIEAEVRPSTGEIDRSATGYVSHERHEELADRVFAEPERSADGWETAIAAQERVVSALVDLLDDDGARGGDVLVVGHGGVGTLLLCHLAMVPIDRRHDQPGQGHHWAFDRAAGRLVHAWEPIDRR